MYAPMKTFQRFLREANEMLPGSIVMIVTGGGFSRKTIYGIGSGRVIYKIENIHQHGSEFKGTTTHTVLDTTESQMEVLLPGLKHGDIAVSNLQLDGLPPGSFIEATVSDGESNQYKKIDTFKWAGVGESVAKKYDSVHFDMSLKYKWIR